MSQSISGFHTAYEGPTRRSGPRVEIMGMLHGQVVAIDALLLVRDLGTGGFGVESTVPFDVGSTHTFRFTTRTHLTVIATATVRHCEALPEDDGPPRFRAGFEFNREPGDGTTVAVDVLLDAVTAVLEFR